MEKRPSSRTSYRLVARFSGNRLAIDAQLREELERESLGCIEAIGRSRACRDEERRVLAESVEWERLGDFRMLAGARLDALKAYRNAALGCLCGPCYDYDEGLLPHRQLRRRFAALRSKMETAAGDDDRLRELIPGEQ